MIVKSIAVALIFAFLIILLAFLVPFSPFKHDTSTVPERNLEIDISEQEQVRPNIVSLPQGALPLKIVFKITSYTPAKCFRPSSTEVILIGDSEEGYSVFTEPSIPIPSSGILLKRQDGQYQCYTIVSK